MNELQQVLVGFAIVVIIGLYLLHRFKAKISGDDATSTRADEEKTPRIDADQALNNLGEPHIPVSQQTRQRLEIEEEEQVPESQMGLSFGKEFEVEKKPTVDSLVEQTTESEPQIKDVTAAESAAPKKSKHIVLEVEDMQPVDGLEDGLTPEEIDAENKPSFGIPENGVVEPDSPTVADNNEPQVFAIIVMGTEEFLWPKVNQTLQGVGLVPSEAGIFVKKDSMGNEIIRVANLMEPGTFPLDQPTNNELKTAGVVLILELPTTVKAPAVMHDMIMMSRKISQRLNGRLYDMQRHLIKESDLQAMRDAAVAYESAAI